MTNKVNHNVVFSQLSFSFPIVLSRILAMFLPVVMTTEKASCILIGTSCGIVNVFEESDSYHQLFASVFAT